MQWGNGRTVVALPALIVMALASVHPLAAQTEVPPGADGPALAAADIVSGILAYTRWPDNGGPVVLCVAGQSRLSQQLSDRRLPSGRAMVVTRRSPSSLPGTGCDAIFLAALARPEQERIARAANGEAIVTITDNDPECSSGLMACLRLVRGGMTFDLSLDAVSRSRVRIDPRVLMLADRGSGRP